MTNRGNDLSDMFELGITLTPRLKPTFAARIDAFNVISLGYSHADLMMFGWSDRNLGKLRLRDEFWGAFAWGKAKLWIGPAGDAESAPIGTWLPETSRPWDGREPFTVGFAGAFAGTPRPVKRSFGECPKLVHLGWIGLYANGSPLDWVDFVLGWTGLDIGGDDTAG